MPTLLLMENAGRAVAGVVEDVLKKQKKKRVAVFCGRGNNGGDGFVCARHLITRGVKADTFVLSGADGIKGEARENLDILRRITENVFEIKDNSCLKRVKLSRYGILIDGIFGTGLNKDVGGLYRDAITGINDSGISVVSIDIPSGLDATTGKVYGVAVKATVTVTFVARKRGLLTCDGPRYSGRVIVKDLGIPLENLMER